jgi:hypothetical protein
MRHIILTAALMFATTQAHAATAPACDTLESPAGKAWARANAWRYADPAKAAAV